MRRAVWMGLAALAACGGGAAPASDGGADVAPESAAQPDADTGDADASVIEVGRLVDGAEAADDGAILPPWRSGTRLRAVVLRPVGAPDGLFDSIHDQQLATPCSFERTADGVMRCMPHSALVAYSDAGCETPVLPRTQGCAPPRYVSHLEGCQATGYQVGAKLSAAATLYERSGAACAPRAPSADVYALTAMPAGAFVAGVERRDDRGGDLAMRYWQSEDGGLFPIGAWDTERGASCVAGLDRYEDRCVPRVTAAIPPVAPSEFTDAACKTPAAVRAGPLSCESEPVSAVSIPEDGLCGPSFGFAGAVPLAQPFGASGGTCAAKAASSASQYFAPGAPLDSFALPALTTVLEGVGRLKVHRYLTAMCLPVDAEPKFHDTLAHLVCAPTRTATGLRCVPQGRGHVGYFSDDGCTVPVYAETKAAQVDCAAPVPRFAARARPFDGCSTDPLADLFEVGARVTPAVLYVGGGPSACSASEVDPTTLDVYAAAPAADPSSLPALEEVTE